ncbi:MAG: cytochrome c [Bryobacterales bacterium]|nr:cytochrome c [Bryobacterales bacterium]
MSDTPKPSNPETPASDGEMRHGTRNPALHPTDVEIRNSPDVLEMHQQIIREMNEPADGVAPTPVWLLMFFFALIGWGGYYIAQNGGGFRGDIYNEDPAVLYRQAGEGAAAAKPVDLMAVGKRTFNNCTQCHQVNGAGIPGAFPPLDGAERVSGPPHVLAAILLHGLHGPLQVKGQTYNGDMPAWGQLSDEEIAGVLTYVRASWSNKAPEVSPALVKAMRTQTASQTAPWTGTALDALAKEPPPTEEAAPAPVTEAKSN